MVFVMNSKVPNHWSFNRRFWACFVNIYFILGMLYTCKIWHWSWTKHVIHICSSCGEIGGCVRIEKGEMKRRGKWVGYGWIWSWSCQRSKRKKCWMRAPPNLPRVLHTTSIATFPFTWNMILQQQKMRKQRIFVHLTRFCAFYHT